MSNCRPFLFAALALPLIVSSSVAAASECPVINGSFYRDFRVNGEEFRRINPIFTKVIGGIYYYRFRTALPNYHPADGKWRPVTVGSNTGVVKVTCTSDTIRFDIRDDRSKYSSYKVYRLINNGQIEIDTDVEHASGIFSRGD